MLLTVGPSCLNMEGRGAKLRVWPTSIVSACAIQIDYMYLPLGYRA
jgi:hypothetical protein